jgi:hypothetical protein
MLVIISSRSFCNTGNIVVEWLTLMLRIREVHRSNLGSETDYIVRGFGLFLSVPPAYSGIVLYIRPRPLPSKCFPIHN